MSLYDAPAQGDESRSSIGALSTDARPAPCRCECS